MRVFSDFNQAKAAISDYCLEKEQDVYVFETTYPCGVEYSLRLRDEVTFPDSPAKKYMYFLPMSWAFKESKNALREAQVWADRIGQKIYVRTHTKYIKGYRQITHYTLTEKIPEECLI